MAQPVKKPNIPCEINLDPKQSNKSRLSNILDALSYRDFRWLWVGSFVSFMAMNMQMITRSWLILRVTDDSPLALTLVTLTFALPMTVVAPFAGALADRFSRKKLIVFSQIGSGAFTLILGTLDLIGIVTFWHIMVIGIFNGSLMSINMPSRQAIISDIVPDSKLMNAISLSNSSMNLTRVAGPALAGFLILLLDTAGVFFVISITSVQVLFGAILEPIFMGKSFSINIIAVLVMLMFWGFIWGVPGLIMAIPITVFIKIILEQFPRTKIISDLLGKGISVI